VTPPRDPPRPPLTSGDDEATRLVRRERIAPGRVIAERYRLERVLTQGGMGSVWVATHLGLDAPVAMKFMTAGAAVAPEAVSRFRREARAAAQIRSSNVVKVLDHGVDDGLPYLVMELLEGEDLGRRLRRVGRLSLAEAARLLVPIARGLGLAHQAGLVHRDLKPENIFLAREGDHEVPKILDFGVAKAITPLDDSTDETTRAGALVGTPFFMSPEQARGLPGVDQRSDLWALGVILYRAVVGSKPWNAQAIGEVIVAICSEPAPQPSRAAPDLGPGVDAFFERALAKDAGHRFQSAAELARAFCTLVPTADLGPDIAFEIATPTAQGAPSFTPPAGHGSLRLAGPTVPLGLPTPTPHGTPSYAPSYAPTPEPTSQPSYGLTPPPVAPPSLAPHAPHAALASALVAAPPAPPPALSPRFASFIAIGTIAMLGLGVVAMLATRPPEPPARPAATAPPTTTSTTTATSPAPVTTVEPAAPTAEPAASAEPSATPAAPTASTTPAAPPTATARAAAAPAPKATTAPAAASPPRKKRELGY
jgi:serine/threonine-protein kinase